MANTTIRALTTLSGANVADDDRFILHDFSANTEVSVTTVALATALNQRIGTVGSANGITITASSTNTALSITQTGTGNAFLVEDSTSPDATPFVINNAGLVGIGTATPTALVHITHPTAGTGTGIILENTDAGAVASPRLTLYRNSISSANSDAIGTIYFMGNSSSSNGAIYANINAWIDDNTTGLENGRLTINTIRDGASTSAMVIGSNGRIRVGSTSTEPTNAVLSIDRPINYNVNGNIGVLLGSVINSDTNGSTVVGYISSLGTQAATFTLPVVRHYLAQEATIGAGSTITAQAGYTASSNLVSGTENYGFLSLNAAAITTGKTHYAYFAQSAIATGGGTAWNFYASGTAPNYFAGVTQFADGAAATPSITNIGDTNTGIFFPAADAVAVTTAGAERLHINSAGNVNIGGAGATPDGRLLIRAASLGSTAGNIAVISDQQSLDTNATGLRLQSYRFANGADYLTSELKLQRRTDVTDFTYVGLRHTSITFGIGTTERMRIFDSGGVSIGNVVDPGTGNLSVSGNILISAPTTETRGFEIGTGRTGNGASFIDLIGDATYSDYGARFMREATGPNAETIIYHRGTGALRVTTQEAAPITFNTSGTERVRIDSVGNVIIGGTTTTPSAILDVRSTTKGFLPPRMTTTQRNAIGAPAPGLVIYNTTTGREEGYDSSQWTPRVPFETEEDRIINGAFDVWQRGPTSTSPGYVTADRWVNNFLGGTVTQTRQSFTIGDVFGINNPQFFIRQGVSGQTLASQYATIEQRIEGVRTYAEQTITVLGWAKRASGTGNMVVEGSQTFGTGGSPSAVVPGIGSTTVTLSTVWTPFAVTMTVPSVASKVLGTANNDAFNLNFWTSAGADWAARTNSIGLQTIEVDLWGVHIRKGVWNADDALLYRQKSIADETNRCYRYYYRMTAPAASHVFAAGYNTSTTVTRNMIQFPVRMRAAPVGMEQTGTAANYLVFHGATTAACTAVPVHVSANEFTAQISATTGATLVAGQGSILGSNAVGAYLAWSAEI